MQPANRMKVFGEGVFARLAAMKKEKLAAGESIIDLSIGAPNIPPPAHVMEVMSREVLKPENYLYAINDTTELRQAVAAWYARRYEVKLDPATEICSLLGSQDGLGHIALSLLDEGDTMLVPDPCYPVFADGPKLAGVRLVYMPMKRENKYLIDFAAISEDDARKAKFMLVSYPNNPTAAIAPLSWYEELIKFAKKYDIAVLHDNAYSELVFDGVTCGSFLSIPGAKDVGIEFNSLSKTYGLAGARIGFCVGKAEIVKYLATLKSNIDYGMFLPIQKAAIAAITGDQSCVATTRAAYEERRDVLVKSFAEAGWKMDTPAGSMFAWAPIPAKYAAMENGSESFVIDMLNKSGVLVTPGSAFGPSGEGFVRMALVQDPDALQDAANRLKQSGLFA